jgi:Ca-activated chloride channel family protein
MSSLRIAGLFGLLCAMLTFGQATKNSFKSISGESQSPPPLRVNVDLVLVHATVTNSVNKYVSNLGIEDFRLWEDKIEQQIQYFSTENVPLSVGIIFDVSGSMQNKLSSARAAANTFLRMGDRDDEYFLVEFSNSPRLVQDFTSDITKLQSRLLFTQAKGNTSLYDALYLGLEKVSRGSNVRKALLLITDGEDNHSRYGFSDVKQFAMEHDVMIYSIGIVQGADQQFSGLGGRLVLESLAELTGGIAFFPDSLDALPDICERIGIDLKSQYVLGYRSMNPSNDGRWRKVQVRINTPQGMAPLHVRARSGYYAPAIAKVVQ